MIGRAKDRPRATHRARWVVAAGRKVVVFGWAVLGAGLGALGAGCQPPASAVDAAARGEADPGQAEEVSAAGEDPLARSGHDPKATIAHLEGQWRLADDGKGPAAWGVAGATLVRRGPDGVAREGWLEAPLPGLLRLRVEGLATWELGLAVDGDRVALGLGRAGTCGPQGCWVADNGLVRRDLDGRCWWHPHRVGGGFTPRFLAPQTVACTLDQGTFTYHLPRRTRPGTTDTRQLRRDGNLLLEPKVVVVTRAPAEAAPLPVGNPLDPPPAPAPVPPVDVGSASEGGAPPANPAP